MTLAWLYQTETFCLSSIYLFIYLDVFIYLFIFIYDSNISLGGGLFDLLPTQCERPHA